MLIATKYGQPWSEAKLMSPMDRKAFIYTAATFEGRTVDWQTGRISDPPKPR